MLLTLFLAITFCASITIMLISAVVFIKDKKLFSSAPKEALELVIDRKQEEFYGARKVGWTLMIMSMVMILEISVISIWDGFRSDSSIYKQKIRI